MDTFDAFMESFRQYMATAPEQEIQARWARVKSMDLPSNPTVNELLEQGYYTIDFNNEPYSIDTIARREVLDVTESMLAA